jgi:hypothetical protein
MAPMAGGFVARTKILEKGRRQFAIADPQLLIVDTRTRANSLDT